MQVKDLKSHPKNPRKMNPKKKEALRKSLTEYGDLSGFVYNRRTRRLLGGNQKKSVIPEGSQITIEHKYETPTRVYTVAEGFILIDGERFKYREVDAPEKWETEAMIAANKHSGEWDRDLLAILTVDHPDLNLELAGFDHIELQAMDISIPSLDLNYSSPEQTESKQANESEKVRGGHNEEADAKYVRETEQTEEQIDTEHISTSKDAYDSVEEKVESSLTKHIVVIDCPSKEVKEHVRESLRAAKFPEQHGVKIY